MADIKLTAAQQRALAVLAFADADGLNATSLVRVSNNTTQTDQLRAGSYPAIYWQTYDGLAAVGLVEPASMSSQRPRRYSDGPDGTRPVHAHITDTGRKAWLAELGISTAD